MSRSISFYRAASLFSSSSRPRPSHRVRRHCCRRSSPWVQQEGCWRLVSLQAVEVTPSPLMLPPLLPPPNGYGQRITSRVVEGGRKGAGCGQCFTPDELWSWHCGDRRQRRQHHLAHGARGREPFRRGGRRAVAPVLEAAADAAPPPPPTPNIYAPPLPLCPGSILG